jgi:predicted metal-dependent hydrolase
MAFRRPHYKIKEDHHLIEIKGREIPLVVRRHPRARRMILRLNTVGDGAVVTIPAHASPADALDLARSQSSWLCQNLDEMGERVVFGDGVQIPFQGAQYIVRHREDGQGTVWIKDSDINVAGGIEHLSRRLGDWLKKQARIRIVSLAHQKAKHIDKTLARITVRDTRTRWGSCSSKGRLSFSWRLIMAPPEILDYVVAHEVAHLAHMNHSSSFWDTVDRLTKNAKGSRAWLNDNGTVLHRIG